MRVRLRLPKSIGYSANPGNDTEVTAGQAGDAFSQARQQDIHVSRWKWLPAAPAVVFIAVCSADLGAPDDLVLDPVPDAEAASLGSDLAASEVNRESDRNAPVADSGGEPNPMNLVIDQLAYVSVLTGPDSPARTDRHWNITGTDLGISFEHDGKIYMVFGDTWGRDSDEGADWRSNVMAIAEPDPEHGYVLTAIVGDDRGEAIELLPSLKKPGTEYTVIPNGAIAVDGRMYLQYMSIRDWILSPSGYKHPDVNGAGIASSDDGGWTWTQDETAYWAGDSWFTQTAMVGHDEYVCVFGTPAGRFGPLRLFRMPSQLLEPEQYEHWTGEDWSIDPSQGVEVVADPVGELSVRWSPQHEHWLMMYRNERANAIVLRTAEQLEGPWDDERVVLTGKEYPTNYAPLMLPITGPDVYFAMSIFSSGYQVHIMRLTLGPEM
jgi:hypothetical protein